MPTDKELREYAKTLPDIYRDILAAYPDIEPNRKAGYGLAFQTLALHFVNTRKIWSFGDVQAACKHLADGGLIEIKNGIFAHPTELGERLIAVLAGTVPAPSTAFPFSRARQPPSEPGNRMFWQIASYPRCEYHVFLSHCAGDRSWLVHPVYDELKRRGIVPWLDREDYYYGRDSRTALRDGLLKSRHVIFFITLGMMGYTRGWCPMELAYADLLQANLLYTGGPLLNFELPLYFLNRADAELPRTAWASLRDRGPFYHPADGDAVRWSVDQIVAFLHREQNLALDMAKVVMPSQQIHVDLSRRPGLVDRTIQFDPGPIP